MKFDFIQVNQSIFDYSEYAKRVLLLKNYLKHRLIELMLEENFKLELEGSHSYHESRIIVYNKELDLEAEIRIRKRNEEMFI